MKNAVAKTIQAYNKNAKEYDYINFSLKKLQAFLDFFLKNLRGRKILDIGCGPGRDIRYFSSLGLNVTGIDLSSSFLRMAEKLVPKAKVIKMDMRKLEFRKNSFDGIWACASLLHIPKAEMNDTLAGIYRVLKPSGIIYVSVKAGVDEKFVKDDFHTGEERFFAYYSKKEIKALLENCGFKVIKVIRKKDRSDWINIFATKE